MILIIQIKEEKTVSQILTVEVPSVGHRYGGDLMRRAAYTRALGAGETGVCLVLVERQDYDPIQVVVHVPSKEASIVLPLPSEMKAFDFGTAFAFPGEYYVVTEQKPEKIASQVRAAFPQSNVIVVSLNRENAFITAVDCSADPPVVIERSTEAAAAAAMVLHQDLENGTMESTIGQPGGILEIGMRKENGKVTGLSAGGPVNFAET